MKAASKREKWVAGILGIVCVGLVTNVVLQTTGVKAGGNHPSASRMPAVGLGRAGPSGSSVPGTSGGPARDPALQLDLLERLESQDLPPLDRDPFEFGLTPAQKAVQIQQQKIKTLPPSHPASPPPPPITVKALGYAEDKSGKRKAILADDQDTYEVREGDSFAGHYKCLQITATAVEIRDESYHQTVQLPFPQ
jgi:hypothetical protein